MKSIGWRFLICFCTILSFIDCFSKSQNPKRDANRSEKVALKNCNSLFGIYAFTYGKSPYPDHFLNVKEDEGSREIVYLFYLIRIPGKRILIDSGFLNESYKKKFGFTSFEEPDRLLKKCGIDPKEITDIVLTHFHFDHAGGIFLFPSAILHIQNHDLDLLQKQSYFPNQSVYLNSLIKTGRIHSFDGTYFLLPEMRILFAGGHTPGSQALEWVATSEKRFLFTGDECYLVEPCKNGIGLTSEAAFSLKRNRDFIEYVRILSEKGTKILTLHDPAILLEGEEIVPGVRLIEFF